MALRDSSVQGGRSFYALGRRLEYTSYAVTDAFRSLFYAIGAGMRHLSNRRAEASSR